MILYKNTNNVIMKAIRCISICCVILFFSVHPIKGNCHLIKNNLLLQQQMNITNTKKISELKAELKPKILTIEQPGGNKESYILQTLTDNQGNNWEYYWDEGKITKNFSNGDQEEYEIENPQSIICKSQIEHFDLKNIIFCKNKKKFTSEVISIFEPQTENLQQKIYQDLKTGDIQMITIYNQETNFPVKTILFYSMKNIKDNHLLNNQDKIFMIQKYDEQGHFSELIQYNISGQIEKIYSMNCNTKNDSSYIIQEVKFQDTYDIAKPLILEKISYFHYNQEEAESQRILEIRLQRDGHNIRSVFDNTCEMLTYFHDKTQQIKSIYNYKQGTTETFREDGKTKYSAWDTIKKIYTRFDKYGDVKSITYYSEDIPHQRWNYQKKYYFIGKKVLHSIDYFNNDGKTMDQTIISQKDNKQTTRKIPCKPKKFED